MPLTLLFTIIISMISKSQHNYNIIRDLSEQVQQWATRLVPETKGLPYNNRLIELRLPTLNFRRQRTDIIQTFKIIKRLESVNQNCRFPQFPSKLMLKKASGTTRGHSEKLQTQSAAVCMCICVCVCVRMTERERDSERETEKVCACFGECVGACVDSFVGACVWVHVCVRVSVGVWVHV